MNPLFLNFIILVIFIIINCHLKRCKETSLFFVHTSTLFFVKQIKVNVLPKREISYKAGRWSPTTTKGGYNEINRERWKTMQNYSKTIFAKVFNFQQQNRTKTNNIKEKQQLEKDVMNTLIRILESMRKHFFVG